MSWRRLFTKTQKIQIYKIYDGKCGVCGFQFDSINDVFQFDHEIPYYLWDKETDEIGPTTVDNGQPICHKCGREKNIKDKKESVKTLKNKKPKKEEAETKKSKSSFGGSKSNFGNSGGFANKNSSFAGNSGFNK